MFTNNVFKPSVNTVMWCKASAVRAVKTMAQTALAMIVGGVAMSDVNWTYVGSAVVLAGVASILTSIAGIPEVTETKEGE